MTTFVIRRLLWTIPVLWAVATITFLLMHAVPGGPFTQEKDLPEAIELALARRYNLDKSLPEQYGLYMWNLVHGDMGLSFRGDQDVADLISQGFFITAQLGVLGFGFAVVLGMGLGILSALNQNGPGDYLGVVFATLGASLPSFILASFLIIIFSIQLGWVGTLGWGGPGDPGDIFNFSEYDPKRMILPVIAVSVLPAAFMARVTRAALLEVLRQDYIRTAKSKGLAERTVIMRHALKNAMIPVLTLMGPLAANLVTGSFIIETTFQIPGIGRGFVDAVVRRDYAMIMGTTIFYAAVVAMANLVVDLMYGAVDPRIRYN